MMMSSSMGASRSRPGSVFAHCFHAAVVLLSLISTTSALTAPLRLSTPPNYKGRSACPARCADTGASPGNWSVYSNLDKFQTCQESLFYDFSLQDNVDDDTLNHRIYACSSWGPDWTNLPANTTGQDAQSSATAVDAEYQVGWWPNSPGSAVASNLGTLVKQLRSYLTNGFAPVDRSVVMLTSYGTTSVGLYIGKDLQNQGISDAPLSWIQTSLATINASLASSVAMQFCQPGQNADHVFGIIATNNNTFSTVQDALTSWSKAECLSFPQVANISSTLPLLTPLYTVSNITSNSTNTTASPLSFRRGRSLSPRGDCTTVQVVSGDSCSSLAQKCGITPAQFTQYNSEPNECSTLQPGEHVCCSAGTLPDFAPKPNSDGSCATYTVKADDSCSTIASTYSLTVDDLESYNKDTWAWNGCADIWTGTVICLSTGSPPMPAAISNAVCGPQKPGTPVPPSGTNISMLNPCPLNACCDVFGQCGTTAEFCTNTNTGAPGTARTGTNGCISNCGTELVKSSPPSQYRAVGYFEGFNLQRPCLYQTVQQVDISALTHLYFAFGVLSSDYQAMVPNDVTTQFEFQQFSELRGVQRILSIGGWAFSTDPSTYMIFREGVTAANRDTMAKSIADFVEQYELDGVNIDWEYPGAPDIPGIPPASPDDGENYLAFLVILKNLLGGKELTIAAPASYWYLKNFPIKEMAEVVDYIIYMTYDLHGQWDSGSQWSQQGCTTGNCLRTDVNLTETMGALVMITKAGVPSNQVVVGVTSYGRSFAMAEAGCYGPDCHFLGTAGDSQAAPGPCTQTPGYIANAEILAIMANSSRVNNAFIDDNANTNILVYDDTQWVGWMSAGIKQARTELYQGLAMGGTTDWATDLKEYNDPPGDVTWPKFLEDLRVGTDPYVEGNRTGNWTDLTCSDPAIQGVTYFTPEQRWGMLDLSNAWTDIINVWNNDFKGREGMTFTLAVFDTIHAPEDGQCENPGPNNNCDATMTCSSFSGFGSNGGSGAGAYEIYNSFVVVNQIYSEMSYAISNAAATYIDTQLQSFEDTFAPIPPAPSDTWLIVLINLLGLGLTAVAAPFLEGVVATLPALLALSDAAQGVVKDISFASIAFGAAIGAAEVTPGSPSQWTPQSQDSFSAYLGQVVGQWAAITDQQLFNLFNGSEASINLLTTLINDGNMMQGSTGAPDVPYNASSSTLTDMTNFVGTAFFGYSIPAVWDAAGTPAFVIDSGYPCSASNPLSEYMTAATQEATFDCYNNNLYYLVYPKGTYESCTDDGDLQARCVGCDPPPSCTPSYFEAPPGLSTLDGSQWGGITIQDLIRGSVNSYTANGNSNNAPMADPLNTGTITALSNRDITTPGYIRLPVCSAQVAQASWANPGQSNSSAPGYPCNPLQGITKCHGYTYQDQTSSASPPVSDCQHIITNIQGTSGEWNTGIGGQRQLVSYGDCKFGVQADGVHGDVTYHTGSQDIVDIITQSIKLYGGGGNVGAKGYMYCDGDVNQQYVEWGLY